MPEGFDASRSAAVLEAMSNPGEPTESYKTLREWQESFDAKAGFLKGNKLGLIDWVDPAIVVPTLDLAVNPNSTQEVSYVQNVIGTAKHALGELPANPSVIPNNVVREVDGGQTKVDEVIVFLPKAT